MALSANINLYDKPEEDGGKVIYVTKSEIVCHIDTTKTLKMFWYHKLKCGDVLGWFIDGIRGDHWRPFPCKTHDLIC